MNPTSSATQSAPRRIWQFEALRGILCWWVVLDHVLINLPVRPSGVIRNLIWGGHAVDVFIILSGFVISSLVSTRNDSWTTFLIKRFFRLWPVFVVCMILTSTAPMFEPGFQSNWFALISNLTMLHGMIPEWLCPHVTTGYLPPSWSISLEWQFYIIAPFIIPSIFKARVWPILLLIVCLGLTMLHIGADSYIYPSLLAFKLHLFFVGILSYSAWRQLGKMPYKIPLTTAIGIAALIAALTKSIPITIWTGAMLSIIPGSLSCFAERHHPKFIARSLCWLGEISYPTYLCHWAILLFIMRHPHAVSILSKLSPTAGLAVGLVTAAPFILLASWTIHNWIETPMNRLGAKITQRPRRTKALSYPESTGL